MVAEEPAQIAVFTGMAEMDNPGPMVILTVAVLTQLALYPLTV